MRRFGLVSVVGVATSQTSMLRGNALQWRVAVVRVHRRRLCSSVFSHFLMHGSMSLLKLSAGRMCVSV